MSKNHTFTGNSRYRKQREIILTENPICVVCNENPSEELDHIIPLDQSGDEDDESNLQAICKDCHEVKTAREQGFRVVRVDIRGRPIGPSNLDL